MNFSSKVPNLNNICGIAIDLSSLPVPSYSETGQPFYDSYLLESNSQSIYYGKRTVKFEENSKKSRSGISFECTCSITFPSVDKDRSIRIEELLKTKFLIIKLSSGLSFLMGRNDYHQNADPLIKIDSDEQLSTVKFTVNSIFPTGFLPQYNSGLLPHSIPVNLLNTN